MELPMLRRMSADWRLADTVRPIERVQCRGRVTALPCWDRSVSVSAINFAVTHKAALFATMC